jgi:hypothetical protein
VSPKGLPVSALTWLALKSLDSSLKSELTNIAAPGLMGMHDEFPSGVKARLSGLALPELEVERPVELCQPAISFRGNRRHFYLMLRRPELSVPA